MTFDRVCGSVALFLLAIVLGVGGVACIRDGHWEMGGLGFLLISATLRIGDAIWERHWPKSEP